MGVLEAKKRWNDFVTNYENKANDIKGSEKNGINHWFQSDDNEYTFDDKTAADQHWHGLVPNVFEDSKNSNFEGRYNNQPTNQPTKKEEPQNTFEKVSRIEFSGGGSGLEFIMSDS